MTKQLQDDLRLAVGRAVVRNAVNVTEQVPVNIEVPRVVNNVRRAKLVPVDGNVPKDLVVLLQKGPVVVEQGRVVVRPQVGGVPDVLEDSEVHVVVEGNDVDLVGGLVSNVTGTVEEAPVSGVSRLA